MAIRPSPVLTEGPGRLPRLPLPTHTRVRMLVGNKCPAQAIDQLFRSRLGSFRPAELLIPEADVGSVYSKCYSVLGGVNRRSNSGTIDTRRKYRQFFD